MSMHYPTVWAFGDSITQMNFDPDNGCWGAMIANALVRKIDFIQRGFSGYTTKNYKPMLTELFTADDVKLCKAVIIFLGANDCVLPGNDQHVPKEEFSANLNEFIDYFTGLGIPLEKILVLSNPPYCSGDNASRTAAAAAEYATACVEVAKTRGCPHINLDEEISKQNNFHEFFVDGLHFSRKGADACFALVWPALQKILGNAPTIGEVIQQN